MPCPSCFLPISMPFRSRWLLRARGILRSEIFVVSKINARSHSLKETPKAIRQSLNRSGLEYIDQYLLHDAISGKERRLQAYKCLLEAKSLGQIGSVGVSNWSVKHLQELEEAGLEMPAVNQIELHPFCQQVCRCSVGRTAYPQSDYFSTRPRSLPSAGTEIS